MRYWFRRCTQIYIDIIHNEKIKPLISVRGFKVSTKSTPKSKSGISTCLNRSMNSSFQRLKPWNYWPCKTAWWRSHFRLRKSWLSYSPRREWIPSIDRTRQCGGKAAFAFSKQKSWQYGFHSENHWLCKMAQLRSNFRLRKSWLLFSEPFSYLILVYAKFKTAVISRDFTAVLMYLLF